MIKQLSLLALVASVSAFSPSSRFAVIRQSALAAEPTWAPPEGAKWEEKDFEAEIKKLEKEAEDRLDAKIAEMTAKIESTGK